MPGTLSATLIEEFLRLIQGLESAGLSYALAGGLAVGVHANPRATEDIDIALVPEDWSATLPVLKSLGFEQLAAPMRLGQGKLDIERVLRLLEGRAPIILDVLVPRDETLAAAARDRVRREYLGQEMWVLSRRALITFKKLRSSKQDLADIEALEATEDDEI